MADQGRGDGKGKGRASQQRRSQSHQKLRQELDRTKVELEEIKDSWGSDDEEWRQKEAKWQSDQTELVSRFQQEILGRDNVIKRYRKIIAGQILLEEMYAGVFLSDEVTDMRIAIHRLAGESDGEVG